MEQGERHGEAGDPRQNVSPQRLVDWSHTRRSPTLSTAADQPCVAASSASVNDQCGSRSGPRGPQRPGRSSAAWTQADCPCTCAIRRCDTHARVPANALTSTRSARVDIDREGSRQALTHPLRSTGANAMQCATREKTRVHACAPLGGWLRRGEPEECGSSVPIHSPGRCRSCRQQLLRHMPSPSTQK